MRVRGLKLILSSFVQLRHTVAPRAGAWVETSVVLRRAEGGGVAPRAGAWVETARKR